MSGKSRYSAEEHRMIRELVPNHSTQEVADIINSHFHTCYTAKNIANYKKTYSLKGCGAEHKYPKEWVDFLRENAWGKSNQEMADLFNEEFGQNRTAAQVKRMKKNRDISSGLTGQFKKGHVPANKGKKQPYESTEAQRKTQYKAGNKPHNTYPVGTLKHNTEGYLIRKTAEPNQWTYEARRIYEEANGPIPKDYCLNYLDGNKENCKLENLILVDRHTHLRCATKGYYTNDAEKTKAGIALGALETAVYNLTKKTSES